MHCIFLVLVVLARQAVAQHYLSGIGKNTWAADDAVACYDWFLRYLNGSTPEPNNCPDNECACGQTGRVKLNNVTGHAVPFENVTSVDQFGIHAVNCSHHPTGECSVRDVEGSFAQAFSTAQSSGVYDGLLDYNLGLWTSSLRTLMDRFDDDNISYIPMTWQSAWSNSSGVKNNVTVYSVLVNPCGSVLIEFISDVGRPNTKFHTVTASRMNFSGIWNPPPPRTTENPYQLTALKIARTATDLDAVLSWYQTFFDASFPSGQGVKVLENTTFSDGAKLLTLKLPDTSQDITSVHLQFWDRSQTQNNKNTNKKPGELETNRARTSLAVPVGGVDCSSWTAPKLQSYLVKSLNEEIRNTSCGFSKWLDFHYSYDCFDTRCQLQDFADRLENLGWKYRWQVSINFLHTGINWWTLYTFDPTGYGIELHFSPLAAPKNPPPIDLFAPGCFASFDNGTCPGDVQGQCT